MVLALHMRCVLSLLCIRCFYTESSAEVGWLRREGGEEVRLPHAEKGVDALLY